MPSFTYTYPTSPNQYTLTLNITQGAGNVNTNSTPVSWSLQLTTPSNNYFQAISTYSAVINGVTVLSRNQQVNTSAVSTTYTLASGTTTVAHNADGTKTIAVSASFKTNDQSSYWRVPPLSVSGNVTLTTIPRASSFTLGGATRTNADVNVTIDRKSTAFTHRVRWRVGSGSWNTASSSATTSASFKVQPSNMANLKSATITVGVQTYSGTTAIGSEATATRTITIPNSTISLSGTANTGSAQTVNISNSGGSLSYTRSWKLGSSTGGNVASWTPPHSALPSATSGTLTCTVVTKNGTATINTVSSTRTITVPTSVLPSFGSITHTEYVANVATLVGAYVQGKTRLTLGVTSPSAGSGSSIKSYSISVGGRSVSSNGGTTAIINQSGTLTITATVTDNRNRTATKTTTITVLPYENPIVTGVSFTRSNEDGTPNTTGIYLTVKATIRVRRLIVSSVEKNKINYQSQSAQMGGSYTTKTNLENQAGTINGNYRESIYIHTFSGYPIDYPYNVRVRGGDIFSWSGYIAGGIPTGVVLQHWGEDTTAFGKMIDSLNYNVLVGTKGLKSDGPIVAEKGINIPDTRSIVSVPEDLPGKALSVEFKSNSSVGNPPVNASSTYSHIINVAGWSSHEGSGGWPTQISVGGSGLAVRQATSATAWGPWTAVGGSSSVAWSAITGKPSTFAPSSHTHTWAQVTGKPAQATRWPTWAEVTGKPVSFTRLYNGTASAINTNYNMTSYSGYEFIIVGAFMDASSNENYTSVVIPTATIVVNDPRRYSLSVVFSETGNLGLIFFQFNSATQFKINNIGGAYSGKINYIYGVNLV